MDVFPSLLAPKETSLLANEIKEELLLTVLDMKVPFSLLLCDKMVFQHRLMWSFPSTFSSFVLNLVAFGNIVTINNVGVEFVLQNNSPYFC